MNDVITIFRQSDNGVETLGDLNVLKELKGPSVFKCDTLELPWYNNQNRISCIPKGVYKWKKVSKSDAIPYEHISILNVPGRAGVCIHAANYYTQILGCIVVGDKEVDINGDGQKDVTNSGSTFKALMKLLPTSGTLIIS